MPTAPTTALGSPDGLLAGLIDADLIDLGDPGRPPHPGGRPCGALCVPACTASAQDVPTTEPTDTRGALPWTTSPIST